MNRKIFVDMDGVIADFDNSPYFKGERRGYGHHPEMYEKDFFFNLPIMAGAPEAMNHLIHNPSIDLYILTKPLFDNPDSYRDKVRWIRHYLPKLSDKIIMMQDKTLLARSGYTLLDDTKSWEEGWCSRGGHFIWFNPARDSVTNWKYALNILTGAGELVMRDIDYIRMTINQIEEGVL